MRNICTIALILAATTAQAQLNPKASYIDIQTRRAELAHTQDPRTQKAISALASCTKLPAVPAPTGHMIIPQRYLSGGHGPVNPEEEKVTSLYHHFEERVTAGMNQWLVTASKPEAACAQQQIDTWAQANALMDYDPKESSQAWFQVEWTLSAAAISESILVNEPSLDKTQLIRDITWLNKVAHRTVDFDKAGKQTNNHHYWRGLAAVATGVISNDNDLFDWGVSVYKQAIDEIDSRGALPQEMARHERAIHYQSFALQPLTPLASFAERQHVPLYAYRSPTGHTIADAVNFFGAAMTNPEIVRPYATEDQLLDTEGPDYYAFAEFYSHQPGTPPLPASVLKGLQQPTFSTRIGGSTTTIAGYLPAPSNTKK